VRLFIDECLSPVLARRLNETGLHDAVHPRDLGRLGEPDHAVLQLCIRDSRTIVTVNARDFRRLIGAVELHPGLVILPAVDREGSWTLLGAALTAILAQGEPAQMMINRVVEIAASGEVVLYDLPTG
jgi:predicted nuclease of predicted toxin-antitoxin system